METVFTSRLTTFLHAVAEQMPLYVPKRAGEHYTCRPYDPEVDVEIEYNTIRMCTPVKEFLFPLRELAAVLPEPMEPADVEPFAVFGLKACDLRSFEILDKVFTEKDFEDPLYMGRREKMLVIASDCTEPGPSCFCNVLGGKPYPETGFDLNVSHVTDGFVIGAGTPRGKRFLSSHASLFADVPDALLTERDEFRQATENRLEEINAEFHLKAPAGQIVEQGYASDVFEEQAETCVECQGCTRVCPTCHCFYLYDTQQDEYFAKMKMWDSCMRVGYAEVAGGGNPRRRLGDRLRHRLMHKFSYFAERYGLDMCVGCGRCVDGEAGDVDIRVILKTLNDEFSKKRRKAVVKKTK